jgi:glycosyltransferase involved in cell wall biosynthesis
MCKSKYLVSAIVSVYNCERFIEGCLQDLEEQTIANTIEIVVINSGSQQNEEAIIRRFQEKFNNIFYIKTEKRETIYKAWNRGIKVATGQYITNANADDRHRRDALEVMADVLEKNGDVGLVYANSIVTHNENESFDRHVPMRYIDRATPEPDPSGALLLKGCFVGPQPMWRKSIHEKIGFFDENFDIVGDYEFWLRAAEQFHFRHINEYLGLYLNDPNSAEHRNPELSFAEWHQVTSKYLKKHVESKKGDSLFIKAVKKKLSEDTFWQGDFLFSKGNCDSAKRLLFQSIGYNLLNLNSYKLLVACYLPPRIVLFLREIKKRLQKRSQVRR